MRRSMDVLYFIAGMFVFVVFFNEHVGHVILLKNCFFLISSSSQVYVYMVYEKTKSNCPSLQFARLRKLISNDLQCTEVSWNTPPPPPSLSLCPYQVHGW